MTVTLFSGVTVLEKNVRIACTGDVMNIRYRWMLTALMLCLFASVAVACPASYVKSVADQNKGTALHDKATKVADKYMTDRGLEPSSPTGETTKPYVIGTCLVEHMFTKQFESSNSTYYKQYLKNPSDRIHLDRDTVDEAANKALGQYNGQAGVASYQGIYGHGYAPAWHHFNRHFSYGLYLGGQLSNSKVDGQGG